VNAILVRFLWNQRQLSKVTTSPDATFYISLVCSLKYLVNTRTDIVFVVGLSTDSCRSHMFTMLLLS
jgi:hypothetical protein